MSEYQYYEFVTVDRPLTERAMRELRAVASRAVITPTRFTNHYEWVISKATRAPGWRSILTPSFISRTGARTSSCCASPAHARAGHGAAVLPWGDGLGEDQGRARHPRRQRGPRCSRASSEAASSAFRAELLRRCRASRTAASSSKAAGRLAEGYGVLAQEIRQQVETAGHRRPTHLVVQAGVGGLAAALADGLKAWLASPAQ